MPTASGGHGKSTSSGCSPPRRCSAPSRRRGCRRHGIPSGSPTEDSMSRDLPDPVPACRAFPDRALSSTRTGVPPFSDGQSIGTEAISVREHDAHPFGGSSMRTRTVAASAVTFLALGLGGVVLTAARRSDRVERIDFHTTVTATTPAYDARVAPASDVRIREFVIPITHDTIEIAKGVKYEG